MIKVYKIVNTEGVVEHVGITERTLEHRFKEHKYENPAGILGRGKFYGRNDVRIELISEWNTRTEAKKTEMYWQVQYNCKDQQFSSRKLNDQQVNEIRNSAETNNILAQRYGVHSNTISTIRNNKYYLV